MYGIIEIEHYGRKIQMKQDEYITFDELKAKLDTRPVELIENISKDLENYGLFVVYDNKRFTIEDENREVVYETPTKEPYFTSTLYDLKDNMETFMVFLDAQSELNAEGIEAYTVYRGDEFRIIPYDEHALYQEMVVKPSYFEASDDIQMSITIKQRYIAPAKADAAHMDEKEELWANDYVYNVHQQLDVSDGANAIASETYTCQPLFRPETSFAQMYTDIMDDIREHSTLYAYARSQQEKREEALVEHEILIDREVDALFASLDDDQNLQM